MTARKNPADMKIRARDDLTPKPRVRRGKSATPEGKASAVARVKASTAIHAESAVPGDYEGRSENNPNRPLTEKQRLFVKEWASGETILTASYRAGYADSGTMAYRMAKDPAIQKLYNEEKALYAASIQITRKQVMEGLIEAKDMAKLLGEPSTMVAAWREIGKMAGFYEPVRKKIDISITGDVTVKRLERMGDAELLKLIKGEVEDVVFEELAAEEGEE